jgi:hypothetical protein
MNIDLSIVSYKYFLIPHNADKNINKKVRQRIHLLFTRINEPYIIGFKYDEFEDKKFITVQASNPFIHVDKIDYFLIEISKFLKKKDQKMKKKIIIEI